MDKTLRKRLERLYYLVVEGAGIVLSESSVQNFVKENGFGGISPIFVYMKEGGKHYISISYVSGNGGILELQVNSGVISYNDNKKELSLSSDLKQFAKKFKEVASVFENTEVHGNEKAVTVNTESVMLGLTKKSWSEIGKANISEAVKQEVRLGNVYKVDGVSNMVAIKVFRDEVGKPLAYEFIAESYLKHLFEQFNFKKYGQNALANITKDGVLLDYARSQFISSQGAVVNLGNILKSGNDWKDNEVYSNLVDKTFYRISGAGFKNIQHVSVPEKKVYVMSDDRTEAHKLTVSNF